MRPVAAFARIKFIFKVLIGLTVTIIVLVVAGLLFSPAKGRTRHSIQAVTPNNTTDTCTGPAGRVNQQFLPVPVSKCKRLISRAVTVIIDPVAQLVYRSYKVHTGNLCIRTRIMLAYFRTGYTRILRVRHITVPRMTDRAPARISIIHKSVAVVVLSIAGLNSVRMDIRVIIITVGGR